MINEIHIPIGRMTFTRLIILLILATSSFALLVTFSKVSAQKQWTVDASGKGDYNTIQKAINVATDGVYIFVRSGNYSSIIVDKGLFIQGDKNVRIDSVEVKASKVTLGSFQSPQVHFDANIRNIILGGLSAGSFHSTQVHFDANIRNIVLDGVDASIAFTSDQNIKLSNVIGPITANNITGFLLDRYTGQLTGSTVQKISISNSNLTTFNIIGKQLILSNSYGSGTASGTDMIFTSYNGGLAASGSFVKIQDSPILNLGVSGNNVTMSVNNLSGQINLSGANFTISYNTVYDYKLALATQTSVITYNTF